MNFTTPSTPNESAFVITVTTPTQSTTRPACRCAGRSVAYPAARPVTRPLTPAEMLEEAGLRG